MNMWPKIREILSEMCGTSESTTLSSAFGGKITHLPLPMSLLRCPSNLSHVQPSARRGGDCVCVCVSACVCVRERER